MRWVPLLAATILSGCAPADPPVPRQITKRVLTTLPATYKAGALAVGEDGATWVYAVRGEGTVSVVSSRGLLGTFPETSPPQITPGTPRVHFWALTTVDGAKRAALQVDGQAYVTALARPQAVLTSLDGRRWGVVGAVGSLEELADTPQPLAVYIDGTERGRYHDTTRPCFSPDGTHTAWLAADVDGTVSVVVDGVVQRTYPPATDLPGTPVSASIPRTTMASEMAQTHAAHCLNDGQVLVLVRTASGWSVQRNGTSLGLYALNTATRRDETAPAYSQFAGTTAIAPESIAIAERAPHAVWWEREAGVESRWRVVRDGEPVDGLVCLAAWKAQPPGISVDGQHVVYACPTNDGTVNFGDPPRAYVVVDGRRYGPYGNVWGFRLSDDGAHAAWAATDAAEPRGQWRYVVDGQVRATQRFDEAWRPRLDPTGTRAGWLGRRDGKLRIGIDDVDYATVTEVLWGPKWTDAHTVRFAVRRGRRLVALDLTAP